VLTVSCLLLVSAIIGSYFGLRTYNAYKFPASDCTNCTQINYQSTYEDDEMVVAYFGAGCFWHA